MNRIILFALFSILALLPIDVALAQERFDSMEIVDLYAHTDYTMGVKDGRILSTAPPYGERRSAILDREINFTLYPTLTRDIKIEGSVNYRIHLRSPVKKTVNLNISLYEIGTETEIQQVSSALIALPVEDKISKYVLGIPISHTFRNESTILFSIIPDPNIQSLTLYWDDEQTETSVSLPIPLEETFNIFNLTIIDSKDIPLAGANVTILVDDRRLWTGRSDSIGQVRALVPKSGDTVYEFIVIWKSIIVNRTLYHTSENLEIQIRCTVYTLELLVRDLLGFPVEETAVVLLKNDTVVEEGNTTIEGRLTFLQLSGSQYDVQISRELLILFIPISVSNHFKIQLSSDTSREMTLNIVKPWLINSLLLIFIISASTLLVLNLFRKRKKGFREYDFDYFYKMAGGDIQSSSSVMISGLPGSGKTVLLTQFLINSLRNGNPCIFIVNLDFPSNIRNYLKSFEPDIDKYEKVSKLIFIDCYSASGGKESSEKHQISSMGDLTGLGVQLSSCLEELGQDTDVFLDSLTPLFTMLRDEYIANFIHSVGAKTKGVNGRFFYTVGSAVGRKGLSAIEAVCDSVIELSSADEEGEYQKKLRIKKMKRKHLENWIDFRVDGDKGIIFRTRNSKKLKT
ncbi:RAD55 family ATPase [[Eubacterium] cellulosolvens]